MPTRAQRAPATVRESTSTRVVADIGGTNARFATVGDDLRALERVDSLRCEGYRTIEDAIRAYLNRYELRDVRHLCLAVAGPVGPDVADLPNSHWSFSRFQLEAALGTPLTVINDFTAQALALDALGPDELLWLGAPRPVGGGIRAVLGPGTGLGVAVQMPGGAVIPSEGGHVAFAPTNEHEIDVLRALFPRYRRVSVERLLSGPGLENLYRANCEISGQCPSPDYEAHSAEEIAELASHGDPVARRAIDDFFDILAAFAGDTALFTWATGGVYLSGGVMRKLSGFMDIERFRARFEDKGRFTRFCETVPVAWITHPEPGLLGCAVAIREEVEA